LKKPAGSIRFRFYKLETEKTEPNPNGKKPSQTGKKPIQTKKPSQTGKTEPKPVCLNRFRVLKKNSV
jgi:hypothetical protein